MQLLKEKHLQDQTFKKLAGSETGLIGLWNNKHFKKSFTEFRSFQWAISPVSNEQMKAENKIT